MIKCIKLFLFTAHSTMTMRILTFLIPFYFTFFSLCPAQGILVKSNLISDLSHTPIYEQLVVKSHDTVQWKEAFTYLDSIDIQSITYLSDGLNINGFVVKPKKEGLYPCIIYNRGGNRDFGSLKIAHCVYWLAQLAKEGYVVIASQYRGAGGSEGMDEFGGKDVNDVLILPQVLSAIPGADTSRIGMYGWSRGGMMTYIALPEMPEIKAAVVGGAVADQFSSIADRPQIETGVLAELIPEYATRKKEALTERSALSWPERFSRNIPLLILHGNADWRVKAEQSLNLALALEPYRIPYRLIIYEGGDHGLTEYQDEVTNEVVNWFDRYVKQSSPLPDMEYHGN